MDNEFTKKLSSALQKFRQWSTKKKVISCASVLLALVILIVLIAKPKESEPQKPTFEEKPQVTEVTFDLKEIINTSTINIAAYPCNGIAEWTEANEKGEKQQVAYIEYKGNVKFSFDFSKIKISDPDQSKHIQIVLPEITRSANLELNSFYCIFMNDDMKDTHNKSNVYQEKVYTVCKDDMLKKLNSSINSAVTEYAKNYISALVEPILSANEFTFTVVVGGVK